MMSKRWFFFLSICCLIAAPPRSDAQERTPATPLITHDPYFSIWSTTDLLTASNTQHWTGSPQPISGLARIDGKTYRFMGRDPRDIPAMEQTSRVIAPTHTTYVFHSGGIVLQVAFFTPTFLNDMDVLSRPVTYLTWSAHAEDGKTHDVSLLLDVDPLIAVNDGSQPVVYSRSRTATLDVLSVGSRDQDVLKRSGDNLRIDWGYFHLAVPKSESSSTVIAAAVRTSYVADGKLPEADDMDMPEVSNRRASHLDAELLLGSVGSQPVVRHLLVSYTEGYAIEYLQRRLRPYWQRNNLPVAQMLDEAEAQYAKLEQQGTTLDMDLTADLTRAGGAHYAAIAVLAYRQAMAAHKLVADVDGTPFLFAKENFSNGDIATVDVLYPSAPFFLFFNPRLLEAQMVPVLQYAALSRWHFPFAPHDLGQYPLANGQEYGGGEKTEENQMPVEESGNMLILMDALSREEGDTRLAQKFWPQLTQWAVYLKEKGLDPENQLSTDDFAGHLAHNTNLSIKAIEAIAAYANLAHMQGKEDVAAEYKKTAREMAEKWTSMAKDGDHYKLAFDRPGTWSQKYNLVWDQLLDYGLFSNSIRDMETAFYLTKLNTYGLPLDNRADYTKLDWEMWTATLTRQPKQFDAQVDPIYQWLLETPSRVPLTDWYDTKTGKQVGFQARSVVGGVYIKALADKQLALKWRNKSVTQTAH